MGVTIFLILLYMLLLINIWYIMQHSGIFHISVGCWALLTFGPKVSKIYGSFTCILIYVLGGISGNLISFLHTPEPTVGGTVCCKLLLYSDYFQIVLAFIYT